MEKISKTVFWLLIASIGCLVIGAIFGLVAIGQVDAGSSTPQAKAILMAIVGIVTIIEIISSVISLLSSRKGEIKTTILSIGKTSSLQSLAVILAFVLSLIGLNQQNPVNSGMLGVLISTFAISLFSSSLIFRSLNGFRKDKENFGYTSIVSFITAGFSFVFGIVALISCAQINSSSTIPALLSVFALLFVLSNVLSFLSLGLMSMAAKKFAPKQTAADADAAILTDMNQTLQDIKQSQNAGIQTSPVKDNISQLREYKKLLDEGIITQEEFDAKKKELL